MCGAHALDLDMIHALFFFGIFCREIADDDDDTDQMGEDDEDQ